MRLSEGSRRSTTRSIVWSINQSESGWLSMANEIRRARPMKGQNESYERLHPSVRLRGCVQAREKGRGRRRGRLVPVRRRPSDETRGRGRPRPIFDRAVPASRLSDFATDFYHFVPISCRIETF